MSFSGRIHTSAPPIPNRFPLDCNKPGAKLFLFSWGDASRGGTVPCFARSIVLIVTAAVEASPKFKANYRTSRVVVCFGGDWLVSRTKWKICLSSDNSTIASPQFFG